MAAQEFSPSPPLPDSDLDLDSAPQVPADSAPHLPDSDFEPPSLILTLLSSRELVSHFLTAFLDRFSQLFSICDVDLNSEDCSPEKLVDGRKIPKHIIEGKWLFKVLRQTLTEIEETGCFAFLAQVIDDHEAMARKIPETIEHLKSLNAEMHLLRQQLQTEDLAHKETVLTWGKTIAQLKQGIKDLKAKNKLVAAYKADVAVAKADCNRRIREQRLNFLRNEINGLTIQVEAEKRVNAVCANFLKQQNLRLMEEAISLATGHDNDTAYMDVMLNKLRDQMVEKQNLLSELEPKYVCILPWSTETLQDVVNFLGCKAVIISGFNRYMAEMRLHEEYLKELNKENTMSIDELRKFETQTKAATKIQKIWRGHIDRSLHTQEMKKIAKKRRQLRAKRKKEKEKEKEKEGKKGQGKKKSKKKK